MTRVRIPFPAPRRAGAPPQQALIAQLVERILGKDEVSSSTLDQGSISKVLEERHEQGEIRANQAPRERGDDWARGPREDDADGGHHQGAGQAGRSPVSGL